MTEAEKIAATAEAHAKQKSVELLFDYTKFAGGVIASSITQTKRRSSADFLEEPIGPWNWQAVFFPGRMWTWIEHTAFWIGLVAAVLSFR